MSDLIKGGFTQDNFIFYDSVKHNNEAHQFGLGQYITIGFVAFFLLCMIIGSYQAYSVEDEKYQKAKSIKKFASDHEEDLINNDFMIEMPNKRKS